MTFSVGQAQPTGLQTILGGTATGIAQGLQQSIEQFHKEKEKETLGHKFESLGLPKELAGLDPQVIKQFMDIQQKQSLMEQLFGSPQQRGQPLAPQQDAQALPPGETLHPGETPGIGGQDQPDDEISARDVQAASLLNPSLGRAIGGERKLQHQERQQIKKRNLEVFDKASSALKTTDEASTGVRQLKRLSKRIGEQQGQNLFQRIGRTYRFNPEGGFTKIGKATSTPQEERYVKLIADQTKTIKDDFGARITNLDLEVFLRRFPDLMMTPEGREDIFETMNDYHEAKRIYNQALKDEIKQTKGKVDPYELDEIVEQKIAPELDEIRKRIDLRGFGDEKQVLTDGATATNPTTGEQMIFKGGKWQPV